MGLQDKMQAIYKLNLSVNMIEAASNQLGQEFDDAMPSEKSVIAQEMAQLNSELFASKTLLEHLRAAMIDVAPPSDTSFQELNQGLAELEKMKESTGQLQKVLQLANALAGRALSTRQDVSSRTT